MTAAITIAIAAGGTAGHINPALALGEVLRERGVHVLFVGQPHKLEGKFVKEAGFELIPIRVSGFDRKRPWTAVRALFEMEAAKRELAAYFKAHTWPNVAVGFGAYVEVALLKLCQKRHIPYVLHEQNSVPGLANKMLAAKANTIAYAFEEAHKALLPLTKGKAHFVEVGNPVRKEIGALSARDAKHALKLLPAEKLLLVFGGSLGAASLNAAMLRALPTLLKSVPSLHILHATGKDAFESYVKEAPEHERYRVVPYLEDMAGAMAAADIVVSRAGASTIAELVAAKRPAVLVPYPLATEDHQNKNADFLVSLGAAVKLQDSELTSPQFEKTLAKLVLNDRELSAMQAAYDKQSNTRADIALADLVLRLA